MKHRRNRGLSLTAAAWFYTQSFHASAASIQAQPVIDWEAEVLQPVAERLFAHKDQPYSGNMERARHQAATRLLASTAENRKMAERYLAKAEGK